MTQEVAPTKTDWPSAVVKLGYAGAAVAIAGLAFVYATRPVPPAPLPAGYYPQPQAGYQPPPPPTGYAQPPAGYVPAPPPPPPMVAQEPQQIPGVRPVQGASLGSAGFEISDQAIAAQLFTGLGSLASVQDKPAGAPDDPRQTIYMFFDPRCPYCHQAHKQLAGRYNIRFVPVAVLGNDQTMNDALPTIRGFLRAKDKSASLRAVMNESPPLDLDKSPDAKLDGDIRQNLEVFITLARNMPDKQAAVPLFVVPKASGPAAVFKGWDEKSEALIETLLKG